MEEKIKRTRHFIQPPTHFEIICPKCKGINLQWSEFQSHIWCNDCEEDLCNYTSPMSGPVPIYCAGLLGIDLREWDMVNQRIIEPHEKP